MALCLYLDGENIAPKSNKEARALLGKHVRYLQRRDIDRSGRGYFFPQEGVVVDVIRREMALDTPGNFVEMVVVDKPLDAGSI